MQQDNVSLRNAMGNCAASSVDPAMDHEGTFHKDNDSAAETQNAGETRQAIKTAQRKANGVNNDVKIQRQTPSTNKLEHNTGSNQQSIEQPSRYETLQVYIAKHSELTASLKTIANIMDFLDASLVNGFDEENQLEKTLQKTKLLGLFLRDIPEKVMILTSFVVELDGVSTIRDVISQLYTDFPDVVKQRDIEQGKETADEVGVSGVVVEGNLSQSMITSTAQNILSNLTSLTHDLTDTHDALCAACREKGLVSILINISKALADNLNDGDLEHTDEDHDMDILADLFDGFLGTLYNTARRTGRTHRSDDFSSFVPTLLDWATTKGAYFGTVALLCLAYLIDEQNNHLIEAKKEMIKFLVDTLEEALRFTDRKYFGYSSSELAEGLSQLASNDINKRILGELGAIKTLTKMVETSKDEEEEENSLKALWALAFDDQNKTLIKNEHNALQRCHTLAKSSNSKVQKAAAGVLWEIGGRKGRNQPLKSGRSTEQSLGPGGSTDQQQKQHIMISYQWDVQNIVKEVKNRLQAAGYCVWMDIDDMGGSTLESMAGAVEDACAVLVCVSQKYKDSPNCRSEAEYAYQVDKNLKFHIT